MGCKHEHDEGMHAESKGTYKTTIEENDSPEDDIS
jgi:hypothetical protein